MSVRAGGLELVELPVADVATNTPPLLMRKLTCEDCSDAEVVIDKLLEPVANFWNTAPVTALVPSLACPTFIQPVEAVEQVGAPSEENTTTNNSPVATPVGSVTE
jgi:hypothetical protein